MKWLLSFSILAVLAGTAHPQDSVLSNEPASPPVTGAVPHVGDLFEPPQGASSFLTGNRDFPNFIGFISNPIQSIDPRAVTELWPMFGAGWVSANKSFLPSGDMQIYGAGLYLALSDRLSFGLSQGGYAAAHFGSDRERTLAKLGLPVPDRDRSGSRNGWLNLGGFAQYTLIADVPNQFLLTAGLRWEAPSGATQVFQGGDSPPYLSPYVTLGKEFGDFHVLANTGYEFPAGSGSATTNTYYLNVHLDRKIGWIYPLVELNFAHRTTSADLDITTPRHGVIDLGTFSATGSTLVAAFGANAVLIPGKLEIGAVYLRPLMDVDRFEYNSMLVKMVFRY